MNWEQNDYEIINTSELDQTKNNNMKYTINAEKRRKENIHPFTIRTKRKKIHRKTRCNHLYPNTFN